MKNTILTKILGVLLSAALVFTMMPQIAVRIVILVDLLILLPWVKVLAVITHRKNEVFNKNFLNAENMTEDIRFITGSDCHDWRYYPKVKCVGLPPSAWGGYGRCAYQRIHKGCLIETVATWL